MLVRRVHVPCRQFWLSRRFAYANRPLDLDPSFRALLNNEDISLKSYKRNRPAPRELEVLPSGEAGLFVEEYIEPEDGEEHYNHRKSPAAEFGSRRIGAVILPVELQNSINALISGNCHFHVNWTSFSWLPRLG
jgi:hypothetical protein